MDLDNNKITFWFYLVSVILFIAFWIAAILGYEVVSVSIAGTFIIVFFFLIYDSLRKRGAK